MSSDEDNESEDDDMSDDSEEPKIERVKEIPAKSFIQELSSVSDSEDEKKQVSMQMSTAFRTVNALWQRSSTVWTVER